MSKIFWIDCQPNIPLAIVLCPKGDEMLAGEIAQLKEGGIDTIVSLLERDEAAWLGLKGEAGVASQNGIQFLSHPFPDANVPLDPVAFRVFVAGLASRIGAGEKVGIHCRGSIGRSTIVAACTMIHLGWTPRKALAVIEEARGCPVPNTSQQEEWILQYKATP